MEKKLIPQALKTRRVILDSEESKVHYYGVQMIALFPLFFGLFLAWFTITGKPIVNRPFVIKIFFFFLIFTLLLLWNQWNRLAFKTTTTTLSRKEINLVIQNVARELGWRVTINKRNLVKAYTNPSFFSGSWGEMITILFDEDKVMINSICNPKKQSSMSAMGRNRKNEQRFLTALKNSN